MQQLWQYTSNLLWNVISRPSIADILDILLVAFLIYKLLTATRDTRASQLLKGLVFLLIVYLASDWLGLRALNMILTLVVTAGPVVVVVLFQTEIRRWLEQIGRAGSNRFERIRSGESKTVERTVVDELVTALINLSRRRVGALVVIEQQTGLDDVTETGTILDAKISGALVENVFEPNTPLHDGAMIIRGYRIVAAGCILKLTEETSISRDLGTRHRAALGVSETTDAITLIVSEETGIISMARDGHLTRHLDARSLRQILEDIYGKESGGGNLLSLFLAKRGSPTPAPQQGGVEKKAKPSDENEPDRR